ncbi:hypothetical protein HPB48_020863 [Haemaphysalis longicornis]|uniref:Uncharacterized protein n=1 Tax=Haemaphysalis longicornis TaxID=44386 RepID=A0A9J6GKB2_HAELO|nr:hypothetical protein HPB48_020863 [Haemaphysalis longicornis]
MHGGDTCPQEVPYCNICKANGHTAVARECGTKVARLQRWQESRNVRATKGRVVTSQPRVFQRSTLPPSSNMATFQLHQHADKTTRDSGTARLLQQLPSESLSHCDKPTYSAVLQDSSADNSQTTEKKVTTPDGNEPLPPALPDHIRVLHDQLVVLQRQYKEALAEYQNNEDKRLGMIQERRRKIPPTLNIRSGRSLQETAVMAPPEGVVSEGTMAPPHQQLARNRWEEHCASFSHRTGARKLWGTFRAITGGTSAQATVPAVLLRTGATPEAFEREAARTFFPQPSSTPPQNIYF